MTRMIMATVAAILLSGPAQSDSPDHIRAKLLATPSWAYEVAHEVAQQKFVNTGKVRFAEKDGKLIGHIDEGWKCDNEVTLRANGFDMKNCGDNDLQFILSGDKFVATNGSYTNTIRPAP
jgi:hypothetical protein